MDDTSVLKADGETDGQTTHGGNTALCTKLIRAWRGNTIDT